MLNYNKLVKDAKKIIHSHSAEDLQEWIDSYNERIALAEQDEPVSVAILNGSPQRTVKTKNVKRRTNGTHRKRTSAKPKTRVARARKVKA